MIQALPKTKSVTFEEFVEWKPEGKYYELHHGVIIEMAQPLGDHEDITGFLAERATAEYLRSNLPYRVLKTVLVKPPENQSAYSPDVLIINRPNLINEPLWKQQSTLIQGASIPLVIEVVSTNWRVDYLTKVKDYEEIGIPEYWIVDYLALGGTPYIGNPKQPTISIYDLINGEYQVSQFRGNQTIVSRTFPELTLTANQIFQGGM
ncbi:Uma2 family endonuclease [Dolichospermum planctonicum UHCC 0167]|jgi:Uma2 family endonuclease|uniref:Uma2 family endonuclease n=1 Tax=Dolichospermum planctonicum TaxID=136072 RepID=UPI0014433628|nr:Uma2 family endonuclease [Dolichospermum planctonicum]MCW9679276.1 Uma2 family endonuclease [Dolichospermum planctonicum UHCC 0167]